IACGLLCCQRLFWRSEETPPAVSAPGPSAVGGAPVRAPADPLSDVGLVEGKIGKGETVSASLRARGLDTGRIGQIVEALRREFDFRYSRSGDTYTLKLARKTGEVLAFEYHRSPTEIYVVTRDDDGLLRSFKKEEAAAAGAVTGVGGVVGDSLFSTLEALGESSDLGSYLGEVLAWDVDLYSARKGDRFRLLVEKGEDEGSTRYGR